MSVRGLTVTAGAAAGLAGLLALTLIGGLELAGEAPSPGPEPDRARPLTAVQPDLRQALLSEGDLSGPAPTPTPTPTPAPRVERPALASVTHPAHPAGVRQPEAHHACRSLVEHQLPLWRATPPRESTSARTLRPEDAALHQVLAVFDELDAQAAFRQLRETVAGCEEFPATLQGEAVTVLLRPGQHFSDIGGDIGREESTEATPSPSPTSTPTPTPTESPGPSLVPTSTPTPPSSPSPPPTTPPAPSPVPAPTRTEESGFVVADEAYALELTVHTSSGTLTGWLALDRVGPAISVLRRLGPRACSPEEALETRRVALTKLRELVDGLR